MTTETEIQIQTERARVLGAALCRLHSRFRPDDVVVTPAGDGVWTLTVPTEPNTVWRGGFLSAMEGWFARVDPTNHEQPWETARPVPLPILDAPPPSRAFNAQATDAATEAHIASIRNAIEQARLVSRHVQPDDAADVARWHPLIEGLDWLAPEGSNFDPRISLYQVARDGLAPRDAVRAFVRALDAGRAWITATTPTLRAAIIAAEMPSGYRLADLPSFQNLGTRQSPKLSAVQDAHDQVGDALDRLSGVITEVTPLVPQFEEAAARRVRTVQVLVREGAETIRAAHRVDLLARIERLNKTVMVAESMVAEA